MENKSAIADLTVKDTKTIKGMHIGNLGSFDTTHRSRC